MVGSKGKHVHCLFFLIRLLSCSLYFNKKTAFQSESENKVKMSHTEECIRNFDENCSECNEWKIYQQGLDERRNFLTNFWARLEGRKEHHIPHDSNVNPRLKPTSNETRTMKCAFCPELFSENAMKIHLQWFHPFHETNAMENTSMPESQMESRTELQISRESGVNPRLKQTMDEKKTWKCAVCARRFLQKDTLKKHVEMKHKKKKTLRCDMDEENTTNEAKELNSMPEKNTSVHEEDTSTSGQEVSMAKENASLTEGNTLVNEENNSVNEEENKTMPEINEENTSMNQENAQMNHENTSGSEEDILTTHHVFKSVHASKKSYKCQNCIFSSLKKQNLKKHVESVHRAMKPIECEACDYTCLKKAAMKEHVKSAHEKKEPYSCLSCNFQCFRKNQMKQHAEILHENKKQFMCNICDYRCSKKDNLKIHVEASHHLKKPIRT